MPLRVNVPVDPAPAEAQVRRAAEVLENAIAPVVLAGPGIARDGAMDALVRFSERLNLPVATTFLGKGVFPDDHPNALGTIGFMVRDYANFGFDKADVVVAVGYDLRRVRARSDGIPGGTRRSSTSTGRWPRSTRPTRSRWGSRGGSGESLDAIAEAAPGNPQRDREPPGERYVREELESGAGDDAFPVRPQRIVARRPGGARPGGHRAV